MAMFAGIGFGWAEGWLTMRPACASGPAHNDSTRPIAVSMVGALAPIKGVSPYTAQLVDALSSHSDVSVDFVGFKSVYPRWAYPGGSPIEEGVPPRTFPYVRVRNILKWYDPTSWLRAGLGLNGEIVHAQWWSYVLAPIYLTVLAIARKRGKRIVITVHNIEPHESGRLKRLLNRAVLGMGDGFIVHSEQNKATLQRIVNCSTERIFVVPMGVLDTPRVGLDAAAARSQLGLPTAPERKIILCFGNIRPYKGVHVLLRAFAEVVHSVPDTILVIAGRPWTKWEPYEALISQLGIANNVKLFLDFVPTDQVEALFVASDIVVLPYTQFDAQSAVGTLALPYGRPLIVTDVGALPDLVRNADVVVPPGDPDSLARALVKVLSDEVLCARLAAQSLEASGALEWGPIAELTVQTYRSVLRHEGDRRLDESSTC